MAADSQQSICGIQKIALYKTKSRFYLVGSNISETKFRVLKIDRTVTQDLVVIDDKVEYDENQIKQLLAMIDDGNRPKHPKAYEKDSAGLHKTVSAFGIVGFFRFLEGYYIILISERKKVAQIGGHTIYKIMDTCTVAIPNETVLTSVHNDNESKYLKSFQNVDLSSNFYFSYTYDLSQTLQCNMSTIERPFSTKRKCENCSKAKSVDDRVSETSHKTQKHNIGTDKSQEKIKDECEQCLKSRKKHHFVSSRSKPFEKFVWNMYLLKNVHDVIHPDWMLYITHGFVGQCNINVYGRPLYLTLIARRSNEFAGTRYLKRGSNDLGFVANDVETEQIVNDASTLSFRSGGYTSYVQIRGSVPLFWSQDLQHGVVPKPQIQVDRSDPYSHTASQHFNRLLRRFGSPIIVFNLVKKREKKKREQILGREFEMVVDYLNQFLPLEHNIRYLWFDMAKFSKIKHENVLEKLEEYAEQMIESTGFFHSGPNLYANETRPHSSWTKIGGYLNAETLGREQTGVVRVNCVDCLDRTNIAQFVLGKHVLGLQLYALGVIENPVVKFDCDAVRLLEDLYEDHGDTLALQYGGSQLVHRIRTYLKTAPWTSHSRDIYQTLCRYYSGAFTDSEKQQAINLFLGKFIPSENFVTIWDHPTDYYFHHIPKENTEIQEPTKSYSKWYDDDVISSLPLPLQEVQNRDHILQCNEESPKIGESVDLFDDYYRPEELTEMELLFSFNLPSSHRELSIVDHSPFVVRGTTSPTNVTTSRIGRSTTKEEQSSSSDSDSDIESEAPSCCRHESCTISGQKTFQDVFPTMEEYYGVTTKEPTTNSYHIYESFSDVVYQNGCLDAKVVQWSAQERENEALEQLEKILNSNVPISSLLIYENSSMVSQTGKFNVTSYSMTTYENYVNWLP